MADFTILNGYTVKDPNALHTYDTVTDLKADTKLKAGNHAKTKGYAISDDGGQGEYIIVNDNTLVDDGGSIHALANGLFAKLIFDKEVNVKQFGAKGDGVTDDSIAIQNAINAGDDIVFTNGNYYITESLTLHDDIKINGNGSKIFSNSDDHAVNAFTGDALDNVEIYDFAFESVKRSIAITNSTNAYLHDLDVQTNEWGMLLRLTDYFKVENVTFNQTRTDSYSNTDGVHINGGKHGVIRNIYGTTDDDMIALNADESSQSYGEISDILIDHVVTINAQEHGGENSTYRGIKLLSRGSLIDNIRIINCDIASDHDECVYITDDSNETGGIVGDVYIDNCIFKKNHNRNANVIYADTSYNKLSITNTKLIYTGTGSGGFIDHIDGKTYGDLFIDNVVFDDKKGSEYAYINQRGTLNNLTITNIDVSNTVYYQFISLRGTVDTITVNNIRAKYARYVVRVNTTGDITNVNIENVTLITGVSVLQLDGQVARANLSNIITNSADNVITIATDQTGLILSGSNINSSTISSINDASHTSNVRIKSGLIAEFIPTSARPGDTFIYRNDNVVVMKLYSNGAWVDIS